MTAYWSGQRARGIRRGTFAQGGEDRILTEFFRGKTQGSYIDVGANHPWIISNTYLLYRSGWCGITIEPLDWLAQLHRRYRPRDTCLTAACGASIGNAEMFVMDPHVASTLDKSAMEAMVASGGARLDYVTSIPLVTVGHVTACLMPDGPDILFTDTEDYDLEVLKGVDWEVGRPRVVVVESTSIASDNTEAIAAFMVGQGYTLLDRTRHNLIYHDVARSSDAASEK